MSDAPRREVVNEICALVGQRIGRGIFIVGVDGPDASGKTHLADEMAQLLEGAASVVRLTIDRFHFPPEVRHARESVAPAESFYEDSFDLDAFEREVLLPLRGPAPRSVCPGIHDAVLDVPDVLPRIDVHDASVVILDGIFLGRPRIRPYLDLWVYLDVSEEASVRRGVARDAQFHGGAVTSRARYVGRYLPGQRLYRRLVDPICHADVVVDNEDLSAPRLVRGPSTD